MSKLIEVKNLCFGYGSERILNKINFSVRQGDFTAIIGSNGTGKSTLLKLLLGELTPEEGSISLLGEDIKSLNKWYKIGYVPQNSVSNGGGFPATALEIVKANLYSQIGFMNFPKKEHTQKAIYALQLVGMENYAKSLIGNLSGGQRQRVMLARVLVNEPEIMLLDEPTTGVDVKSAEVLYELLSKLNNEKLLTIVMVTHDVARASLYVSRTLCLENGTMIELKPDQLNEELIHKHKHPEIGSNEEENNGDI